MDRKSDILYYFELIMMYREESPKNKGSLTYKLYNYHHIKPRSQYPELENEKSNIIILNTQQHTIAHYFLMKAVEEKCKNKGIDINKDNYYLNMRYAFYNMYKNNYEKQIGKPVELFIKEVIPAVKKKINGFKFSQKFDSYLDNNSFSGDMIEDEYIRYRIEESRKIVELNKLQQKVNDERTKRNYIKVERMRTLDAYYKYLMNRIKNDTFEENIFDSLEETTKKRFRMYSVDS